MDFDWKKLLGQVAPVLGTAIGGPFGALAGTTIKAVLGLSEDADETAMGKALEKATPDQLAAIKAADNTFRENMRKLDVDILKLDADDRANARLRETNLRDWIPGVLAVLITGGFFSLLWWLLVYGYPSPAPGTTQESAKEILSIMIGALGAAWTSIVSYYFGSSAGSSKMRETLQQVVAK